MFYAKLIPIENDKLPVTETKNLTYRAQEKYDSYLKETCGNSVGDIMESLEDTEASARKFLQADELDVYYNIEMTLKSSFCGEIIYGSSHDMERHTVTKTGKHYCNYACLEADYLDEVPDDIEFKRR